MKTPARYSALAGGYDIVWKRKEDINGTRWERAGVLILKVIHHVSVSIIFLDFLPYYGILSNEIIFFGVINAEHHKGEERKSNHVA